MREVATLTASSQTRARCQVPVYFVSDHGLVLVQVQ